MHETIHKTLKGEKQFKSYKTMTAPLLTYDSEKWANNRSDRRNMQD